MSEFNIWLETEEVDENGDQIQELDELCEKLAHVTTREKTDEMFRQFRNCHIAYSRLRQFCQMALQANKMTNPVLQMQELRMETLKGLNMVGLSHLVE